MFLKTETPQEKKKSISNAFATYHSLAFSPHQ